MEITGLNQEVSGGAIPQLYKPTANGNIKMAKKKAKPTKHSAVKRELKTPKYQVRVMEDKSKYRRNRDKNVRMEEFRKVA